MRREGRQVAGTWQRWLSHQETQGGDSAQIIGQLARAPPGPVAAPGPGGSLELSKQPAGEDTGRGRSTKQQAVPRERARPGREHRPVWALPGSWRGPITTPTPSTNTPDEFTVKAPYCALGSASVLSSDPQNSLPTYLLPTSISQVRKLRLEVTRYVSCLWLL